MILSTDANLLGPFVCELTKSQWHPGTCTAIGCLKPDGSPWGAVLYERFNGSSVFVHVAGLPGWCSRNVLKYIFDYPFNQLGVSKLIGFVDSSNLAARNFDAKIGFIPETTILGAGRGGSDLIVYTMTREQCRWLRRLNHE